MLKHSTLYHTDFYAWANEQAALLRAGRLSEADIEKVAVEIESMGRGEKRALTSGLAVLLLRLLKWRYQPGLQGPAWRLTIERQRLRIEDQLADNPSLKSQLNEVMARAYRHARIDAERQSGLPAKTFPETSPFTFDEAMSPEFWPDQ